MLIPQGDYSLVTIIIPYIIAVKSDQEHSAEVFYSLNENIHYTIIMSSIACHLCEPLITRKDELLYSDLMTHHPSSGMLHWRIINGLGFFRIS